MNTPITLEDLREYAFGIADAVMVEQLPEGVFPQPLVPKKLMQSAHLMPALIDLRRTPIDQLNTLLDRLNEACENGEPPAISLFIKSKSSAAEMARHWNGMQLAQPQLGRKVWLRLHDPRVLHQLLRILAPTQRAKLLGSSQEFIYWVGRAWVTTLRQPSLAAGSQGRNSSVVPAYAGPASWNWGRIERIGLVNRALLGAGISEAPALASQGALAEQLIERGVGLHALFEPADLVEFAVRGLQTHPAFDEHVEVARAIRPAAASSSDSYLADRFALIDEQVWSSLRYPTKLSGESHHDCGNKVRIL